MGEPSEIINSVPTDVDAKELKNVSDAMKIAMKDEQDISIEILVVMALLLLALASGLVLKKSGHKYLQEAALTVIIGALAGLWLKQYRITKQIESITGDFHSLFMIFLLPPIIFESGYNMNKKHFFNNIGTILMFSFVGTFLSIFLSAIMFWGAGLTGYSTEFSPKAAFAFGSLISATDPVSVLAIFGEMGADANLYSIVFGESIFNDAVAIVVYETVIHSG
jgi:solute carrier family 9 (sodium/hydrogen exchanger), member 8